jgi:hypothetical protein
MDEEVHRFINDLERAADTYLYGRRMYETMVAWETTPSFAAELPLMRDFDPESVRQLKATTGLTYS